MSYYTDVRAWHKGFEQPVEKHPVGSMVNSTRWRRLKLITEEYDEFVQALANEDKVETLDALADMVFVILGTAVEFGWDFDEAWSRVCESNWSKLGPDGKPLFNKYGKIQKGPNFKAPDLEDLV